MKNLLLALVISLGFTAHSQIYVGPEFGSNFIEVKNEDIGRSFQPGWFAGGIFEYRFNNWFGIKTGVNYSQKRQAFSEYDTTLFSIPGFDIAGILGGGLGGLGVELDLNTYSESHGRIASHYIEIPLMARFAWKDYYLGVGGFGGFMLSAKTKTYAKSRTPFVNMIDLEPIIALLGQPQLALLIPEPFEESTSSSSSKGGLRTWDYGLKATLGYQSDHFGFNASYQFGLPDYRTSPDGAKDRHHFVQLTINYLFELGKKSGSSSL